MDSHSYTTIRPFTPSPVAHTYGYRQDSKPLAASDWHPDDEDGGLSSELASSSIFVSTDEEQKDVPMSAQQEGQINDAHKKAEFAKYVCEQLGKSITQVTAETVLKAAQVDPALFPHAKLGDRLWDTFVKHEDPRLLLKKQIAEVVMRDLRRRLSRSEVEAELKEAAAVNKRGVLTHELKSFVDFPRKVLLGLAEASRGQVMPFNFSNIDVGYLSSCMEREFGLAAHVAGASSDQNPILDLMWATSKRILEHHNKPQL